MSLIKYPYTNLHELNLDWIIEQLGKEGVVISVNGEHGIVTLTAEDIKRAPNNTETVGQALTTQGTNLQNVRTQIGTTELPTIAQTITGAIAENAGEIATIQDDVIGSTTLPTTAQTLTGAISEIDGQLNQTKYVELLHTTELTNGTGELCIYKTGNIVHVDFTVSGITDNTIIAYLPMGYGVTQRGCFGALASSSGKAGWLYTTSDRRLSVQIPDLEATETVVGACSYYIG